MMDDSNVANALVLKQNTTPLTEMDLCRFPEELHTELYFVSYSTCAAFK